MWECKGGREGVCVGERIGKRKGENGKRERGRVYWKEGEGKGCNGVREGG